MINRIVIHRLAAALMRHLDNYGFGNRLSVEPGTLTIKEIIDGGGGSFHVIVHDTIADQDAGFAVTVRAA